jgi:hypothetical protein
MVKATGQINKAKTLADNNLVVVFGGVNEV